MISQELKSARNPLTIFHSLFRGIESIKKNILLKRRIKRFDKMYAALVKDNSILKKKQKEEIDEFWHVFAPVYYSSFSFYTEKTGIFDIRYIPDSLHRSIIDGFFNDWTAAKYLDNKCYYPLMFQDVNIPTTVAYRLNGFWYQKLGGV